MRRFLVVMLGCGFSLWEAHAENDLSGDWLGTLSAGGTELRLLVHLQGGVDGYTGDLDSIDQGATGLPLRNISVDGNAVSFELSGIAASFSGTYDAEAEEIAGVWRQGGGALPLTLRRTDEMPILERPQEPAPPYPYGAIEVEFPHASEEDVRFAGTLTIPKGEGPFPAALLISGSGPQDRDETVMGHRPFLVLADYLTRQGIAVLRYDDRGVGGSTGDFATATTQTFATDAASGVVFLRARPEVRGDAVGLIGHSEGAIVAPIVAVEREDVRYLVLLAAPAVPGEDILLAQTEQIARAEGVPEPAIQRTLEKSREIYGILKRDGDRDSIRRALQHYYDDLSIADRGLIGYTDESGPVLLDQLTSPWFREFFFYDPQPNLQLLACPVLALYGAKDLQVPPDQNLAVVRDTLTAAPTLDTTVEVFPDLNHLFQTAVTGAPSEYARITETMAPAVLQRIAGWILERVGS